jgi:hypothetical protein
MIANNLWMLIKVKTCALDRRRRTVDADANGQEANG